MQLNMTAVKLRTKMTENLENYNRMAGMGLIPSPMPVSYGGWKIRQNGETAN